MATPFFPQLRPGATPTAADFNALTAAVSAALNFGGQAFGDIGISQGLGGLQLLDGREKAHWAKIGARGTGAAYAHTSAAPVGDGTFDDVATSPDNPWGTAADQPAREVNGDTTVAVGAYVQLYPDPRGNGWLFNAGGGSGSSSASCPAPGTDPSECIRFTVNAGAGRCAAITAAVIASAPSGGWWVAGSTITTAAGAGTLRYRINSTGYPECKITVGVTDYYGTPEDCDSEGRRVFRFGGSTLCTGTVSTESCDNGFTVSVGCVPCGYDECTGWYCDDATGQTYYAANCDALAILTTALGASGDPVAGPTCDADTIPAHVNIDMTSTSSCMGTRSWLGTRFGNDVDGYGFSGAAVEDCSLDTSGIGFGCNGMIGWTATFDGGRSLVLIASSSSPFAMVWRYSGPLAGLAGPGDSVTTFTITAAP